MGVPCTLPRVPPPRGGAGLWELHWGVLTPEDSELPRVPPPRGGAVLWKGLFLLDLGVDFAGGSGGSGGFGGREGDRLGVGDKGTRVVPGVCVGESWPGESRSPSSPATSLAPCSSLTSAVGSSLTSAADAKEAAAAVMAAVTTTAAAVGAGLDAGLVESVSCSPIVSDSSIDF